METFGIVNCIKNGEDRAPGVSNWTTISMLFAFDNCLMDFGTNLFDSLS